MAKLLLIVLNLVVLVACDDPAKNEAQLLLQQVDALDIRAPLAERSVQIEALQRMGFRSEAIRQGRDRCVEAHRHLVLAERAQRQARSGHQGLSEGSLQESQASRLADLEASLRRSNQELEASRLAFEACEAAMRELRLRYPSRRAGRA